MPDLAERYDCWIAENPSVYSLFVELTREWLARTGSQRAGAKSVAERLRWEIAIRTTDPDFQINNTFVAFLARDAAVHEADLRDVFEFRHSAADAWALAKLNEFERESLLDRLVDTKLAEYDDRRPAVRR